MKIINNKVLSLFLALLLFTSHASELSKPFLQYGLTGLTSFLGGIMLCYFRKKYQANKNINNSVKVGYMEIKGPINDSSPYLHKIQSFIDNNEIKAVLIRVNCLGGNVSSSSMLYHQIETLNAKKPVVALLENACSGGFHSICSAKYLIAPSGANIGSIGVYLEVSKYSNIITKADDLKADTQYTVIFAGAHKAATNQVSDALSTDQKKVLQKQIDEIYEQFCSDVAKSRNVLMDAKESWADGLVHTGNTAFKLGFINEIGSLNSAKEKIEELVKPHLTCKKTIEWVGPTLSFPFNS